MNKKIFGRIGEEITCKYLIKSGYKIIERNFFYRGGELDIIAYEHASNEIVFVEVKTRANTNYGVPSESVDNKKIKHIVKGAKYYLHIHNLDDVYVRFDVIELYFAKEKFFINHIKQII